MQITKKKSFVRQEDGTYLGHDAYRLTKSFRDSTGRERKAHVLYLGSLDGLTKFDRSSALELCSLSPLQRTWPCWPIGLFPSPSTA